MPRSALPACPVPGLLLLLLLLLLKKKKKFHEEIFNQLCSSVELFPGSPSLLSSSSPARLRRESGDHDALPLPAPPASFLGLLLMGSAEAPSTGVRRSAKCFCRALPRLTFPTCPSGLLLDAAKGLHARRCDCTLKNCALKNRLAAPPLAVGTGGRASIGESS